VATQVDVIVGTIGRAHGLRGEVTVRLHSDYAEERFAPGSSLSRGAAGGAPLEVLAGRRQGDVLLVAFRGVDDRSTAETLRGVELWAKVEPGETDEDEFHDAALVGLQVRCQGVAVGRVTSVTHNPAQDLLVIATSGRCTETRGVNGDVQLGSHVQGGRFRDLVQGRIASRQV